MVQALVQRTACPWTFGVVDGRGEKVVHVGEGVKDVGVSGLVEARGCNIKRFMAIFSS
jgi:hypothetical protein